MRHDAMDDLWKYVLGALLGIVVLLILIGLGGNIQGRMLANDCRDFGKFRWGGELYSCERLYETY